MKKVFIEGILEEIPEIHHVLDMESINESLIFFTSYLNFDLKVSENFNSLYCEDDVSNIVKGSFTIIALTNQLNISLQTLENGYNGICQIKFDSNISLNQAKKMIPIVKNWYEYEKRYVFECL